jgi:hypothetical protein
MGGRPGSRLATHRLMRSLVPRLVAHVLAFVPVAALALACGDGSDLPSGRWQAGGAGSGARPATGSSSGGPGAAGSSSGAQAGSSSGTTSTGSSSGSTPPAAPPNLGVSVDQASLQMQLLASSTVHVSVAPNGYSGSVTLAAGTLPAGVTATFNPPTLALDGSSAGTATLTLATIDSTPPGTVSLDVQATADGATAHASVSIEVQSVITIHIPAGVNNLGGTVGSPVTSAYGPYPFKIVAPQNMSASTPVTVYFMNDDGQSHEIHADNPDQGFGHDPGPFNAHSMDPYVRQVNAVGSYDFYLHDQGAPVTLGLVEIK